MQPSGSEQKIMVGIASALGEILRSFETVFVRAVLPGLVTVFLVGFTSPLFGANLDHLAKLIRTKKCQYCDLRGAPLRGSNLAGADLGSAHLESADLYGANLTGANLSRAALFNADLRKANLTGANLLRADPSGASLQHARYCRTTMPDGMIRNDHCTK